MSAHNRWGLQLVMVSLGLIIGFFMGAVIAFWILDQTYDKLSATLENPGKEEQNMGHVPTVRQPGQYGMIMPENQVNSDGHQAISKDRLIAVREILVFRPGEMLPGGQINRQLDSLLGNDSQRRMPHETFLVEFWMSPLNYRGYRLTGNHLTLFGVRTQEQINLIRSKGNLYLQCAYHHYILSESPEFRPLWPLGDFRVTTYNSTADELGHPIFVD